MYNLLNASKTYKPFNYQWAYDAWEMQQQLHWLPKEVSLADDIKDWKNNLSEQEINLLTQVFRFFTQADIDVNNAYTTHYMKVFQPVEVRMMLTAFANIETIHIAAYAYLLETVGMPETEYKAFLEYEEMVKKHEYMLNWNMDTPENIATTLAVFGAFTEGLQLFASFAMLMHFPRMNKMKGMGQIVSWSVRDETLHTHSIIRLHNTFLDENKEIRNEAYEAKIREICKTVVDHEDNFIDLAFNLGDLDGLKAEDVKNYIRFIADRRMTQLQMKPIYNILKNPLPWMDEIFGMEHANFFEVRSTEYSKAATTGSWDNAFA